MSKLYPFFSTPDIVEQDNNQQSIKYGKSYSFDFLKGDFVLEGDGKVGRADGHQAWVQWCFKTVLTQRFTYLAYSQNYGIEIDQVRKPPTRSGVKAELERVITEALLADPRTEAVFDFEHQWKGDEVRTSFSIKPMLGTKERLEVSVNV